MSLTREDLACEQLQSCGTLSRPSVGKCPFEEFIWIDSAASVDNNPQRLYRAITIVICYEMFVETDKAREAFHRNEDDWV